MRKVVVTGATSGFGKLLVEEFLRNGDLVIATGRRLHERKEIFADLRKQYVQRLHEVTMDVTKPDEIANASRQVEKLVGHVDIVINNAGYGLFGALEDLKDEEIRYQMEVNFFGTVNVARSFLPHLRKTKGQLFNFSSVFGFMGFPLTSLYCASKFAVEGLSESLRGELTPHGVQVCLIEPGGYNTSFGENLAWPEGSSAYRSQLENYQSLRVKFSSRSAQDPREVVEGVLSLSKKKRLPMRKVFGKDARFSHYTRKLVPSSLYFFILDVMFKRLFHKQTT